MASSVKLYPKPSGSSVTGNPLPQLLHTPAGLALLELQGTINLPQSEGEDGAKQDQVSIGRLSFPDYHPGTQDPSSTAWMKCVHLYVGQYQRLTGEAKKLPKPIAILRKHTASTEDVTMAGSSAEDSKSDLEVVEIVKYKLVFSQRPEPVGTTG